MSSIASSILSVSESRHITVGSLPVVLMQLVYQYLDLNSMLQLGRCDREMYRVADTDLAWRCDLRRSRKGQTRIVLLDSTHTLHLSHASLMRSHASIHYDLCHDSKSIQDMNGVYHWKEWNLKEVIRNEIKFNVEIELDALSQVRHLKSLVIGGPVVGMSLQTLFKQVCMIPTVQNGLEILVLGINEYEHPPHEHKISSSLFVDGHPYTDPCLDLITFESILSLASLLQLSLNSSYYSIGQLESLRTLPFLHSLHLYQDPCIYIERYFDIDDLCTIGQIPQLTSLSIMLHHDFYTPMRFVRIFQQPRLKMILRSVTISRRILDSVHGSLEQFEHHHVLEAFHGYVALRDLNLLQQGSKQFHHCLLDCLSNSNGRIYDLVHSGPLEDRPFLPSLTRLLYHDVVHHYLPHPNRLRQFLHNNERSELSVILNAHSPPQYGHPTPFMLEWQQLFRPLLKYQQLSMIEVMPSISNCHIRRLPTFLVSGSHMLRPLILDGWLPNTPHSMSAIRTPMPESILTTAIV